MYSNFKLFVKTLSFVETKIWLSLSFGIQDSGHVLEVSFRLQAAYKSFLDFMFLSFWNDLLELFTFLER